MIRFFKNDIFTCSGDTVKILFSPVVNDDGTIDLVESGKEDLQGYIDSFTDSVNIEVLIKRFASGELNVFNQRECMYGDFTKMPKSFAEFLQVKIDADRYFDTLPIEIKKNFDNDKNKFFALAGQEEWFKNLGIDLNEDVEQKGVEIESNE